VSTLAERRERHEQQRVALKLLDIDVLKLDAAERRLARSIESARRAGVSRAEIVRRVGSRRVREAETSERSSLRKEST
jgi:hypothetical protein